MDPLDSIETGQSLIQECVVGVEYFQQRAVASEDIGAKAKYQIVACVMAYHCAEDDDENAEEA